MIWKVFVGLQGGSGGGNLETHIGKDVGLENLINSIM